MAQIPFTGDTTPSQADLDANFTELYDKSAWSTTGIGYAAGSGGTVTQITSKSTSVTINKTNGRIVMHNASLAAGASVAFNMSNTTIDGTDVVVVHPNWAISTAYRAQCVYCGAGLAAIKVTNDSGGSLSDALVLNFVVIKAGTS